MIEVDRLSKRFGAVEALRDVSFSVEEGEILGFLGPNGAGKSTTMRILAGFLPGDSGTVRVAGYDVRSDSLSARRQLGYLPEGVPLYPDMRVKEYMRYRARIKGIPFRQRQTSIDRALDKTRVTDVRRQIIGTLSRGYRQRVGLADALLAEPRVLILDEPTVGLDPEQVRQFRALLGEVGEDRTVILSTHILSEVELSCSSVVIIRDGRIVARDRAEDLRRRYGSSRRVVAEIAGPTSEIRSTLGREKNVRKIHVETLGSAADSDDYARYILEVDGDDDIRPMVFDRARKKGWRLRELRSEEMSLEDVFVGIMGEAKA